MNYGTTFARKSSVSFASEIDKKGRAIISAELRKILGLKFGSLVLVCVNGKSFETKVDERGRFSFPARIRKNSEKVSGIIEKISNGRSENRRFSRVVETSGFDCRDGVISNMQACGVCVAGENPARGPIVLTKNKIGGEKNERCR